MLSYGPIRAAVCGWLIQEPGDGDWHTVTATCGLIAAIAHHPHETWWQQPSVTLHGVDPRRVRVFVEDQWTPEIEAVREVSALITASLIKAGWSTADVERAIEQKLALEFVLVPPAALN